MIKSVFEDISLLSLQVRITLISSSKEIISKDQHYIGSSVIDSDLLSKVLGSSHVDEIKYGQEGNPNIGDEKNYKAKLMGVELMQLQC